MILKSNQIRLKPFSNASESRFAKAIIKIKIYKMIKNIKQKLFSYLWVSGAELMRKITFSFSS